MDSDIKAWLLVAVPWFAAFGGAIWWRLSDAGWQGVNKTDLAIMAILALAPVLAFPKWPYFRP